MEVCVESVQSALNAEKGGAIRIELCSSLSEGGLTPTVGMLGVVKQHVSLPVYVMVRPRGGDFCYSSTEMDVMREDIINLKKAGADGFVFGILTDTGEVDKAKCQLLLDAVHPLPATFHRAIDMSRDICQSLQEVIALGFERVLSSGGMPTALEGIATLNEMLEQAQGQIVIMPGGGIKVENLEKLLTSCRVTVFHGSAREIIDSPMKFRRSNISMGSNSATEYSTKVTSTKVVEKLVGIAKAIWNKHH